MKKTVILILSVLCLNLSAYAEDEELAAMAEMSDSAEVKTEAVDKSPILSAPIEVEGYIVKKDKVLMDGELAQIRAEIQRQRKEVVLNKEKAKNFKVLKKSVEQLSETTEEYLEEKKAAKAEIAAYNLKVRCMRDEDPSPECAKYNKR